MTKIRASTGLPDAKGTGAGEKRYLRFKKINTRTIKHSVMKEMTPDEYDEPRAGVFERGWFLRTPENRLTAGVR